VTATSPLAAGSGTSKFRCRSAARRAGGVARPAHAEQQLAAESLGERLDALLDRDRRQAAENEALRERNRVLTEEVAELSAAGPEPTQLPPTACRVMAHVRRSFTTPAGPALAHCVTPTTTTSKRPCRPTTRGELEPTPRPR